MTRAALRITALAATLVAIATLAGGCGGAETVALAPLEPPTTLKVAAWDALTLRGIALDSCSAHYFGVAQRLAVRYVTVRGRYDAHRHALPPSMYLPPFGTLIALEEGTCWV